MTDNHPRYTAARMHFEIAKAYNQGVVDAMDAQPNWPQPEDGNLYQRGLIAGMTKYHNAIRKLIRPLSGEEQG